MTYGPGKIIKWLTVFMLKHLSFFPFLFIIHHGYMQAVGSVS